MDNKQRANLIDTYRDAVSERVAYNTVEHRAAETAAREALLGQSQAVSVVREALYHAEARFKCLADDFEKSGDTVNWAMCSVDAERMLRAQRALAAQSSPQVTVAEDRS